ncbi:MAG: hypothetical protein ABSB12_00055 [Candidatus Saccharimonadales bacterium]|jgi:hypothetical protein
MDENQPSASPNATGLFDRTNYQIQHQLSLTKEKFKITDETGTPLLWAATPRMTLKKEFHVYADEAGSQEVLEIKIHKLMELTEVWDVIDPNGQVVLGAIHAEVHLTPKWRVLDAQEQQIAEAAEDAKNIVEHALGIPRKYVVTSSGGTVLGTFDQTYTSLTLNFNMDFSQDSQKLLDRRLGIALGIIVANKALTENEHNRGGAMGGIGGIGGFGGGIRL